MEKKINEWHDGARMEEGWVNSQRSLYRRHVGVSVYNRADELLNKEIVVVLFNARLPITRTL